MVRRRNNNKFSRSNVVNLIQRLFTASRAYLAILANDVDLKNNSLPYTNFPSMVIIISNYQSVRKDNLQVGFIPQKREEIHVHMVVQGRG